MNSIDKKILERQIQTNIIKMLKQKGWRVWVINPNGSQCGLPDLFIAHPGHAHRWIEVKRVDNFTPAQIITFTEFASLGIGVWVMKSEFDYDILFKPPNWGQFLPIMRS